MINHSITHFKQRLLVSRIGIIVLFFAIYFSQNNYCKPFVLALLIFSASISLNEFYNMTKQIGLNPSQKIGIFFSCFYLLVTFLAIHEPRYEILPASILFATLTSVFLPYFVKGEHPLANIASTIFGMAYIVLPLSCVLPIIYFWGIDPSQDGRYWIFFLICVTKMTDTGAYFFGNLIGAHSLAPYISPKKTWEGAVGGILTAIITGVIFQCVLMLFKIETIKISWMQNITFSLAIGIFAQFGDLAESLLKRDAKVKDSSYLPGLGGMLDIIDSLVFTLPLLYIILKYSYGQ